MVSGMPARTGPLKIVTLWVQPDRNKVVQKLGRTLKDVNRELIIDDDASSSRL